MPGPQSLQRLLDLAHRSLASIRGADIAAYRDERLEAGKSPITVNNELIVISHLFNTVRREWGTC